MNEVSPEFLKALNVVGMSWLTRLYNMVWSLWIGRLGLWLPSLRRGPEDLFHLLYRGITLLSLPGKLYNGVLERNVHPFVEFWIQ